MKKFLSLPSYLAIKFISLYQKTFSPDHSWLRARFPLGYCRFYPSCSQYTKEAIERFGLIKGSWLGFKRILRCNPWAEGSVDKIPQDHQAVLRQRSEYR